MQRWQLPLLLHLLCDHGKLAEQNLCACIPAQVYERAIGNVPLPLEAPEKRYWQRYIYLWLNYALWEEMEAEDPDRTREVYRNCLKLIPHRLFTFAKVGGLVGLCVHACPGHWHQLSAPVWHAGRRRRGHPVNHAPAADIPQEGFGHLELLTFSSGRLLLNT